MRSAEEWATVAGWDPIGIDTIRAIQADAFRAGAERMREAAAYLLDNTAWTRDANATAAPFFADQIRALPIPPTSGETRTDDR